MEKIYKLKKGLSLKLKGEAEQIIAGNTVNQSVAILPQSYFGIVPRLLVKEGQTVSKGEAIFCDKASEKIMITSPISGLVKAINRGERRKITSVIIEQTSEDSAVNFGSLNLSTASADDVRNLMLKSGIFALLRQRPYDCTPAADSVPRSIFISAFSSMPLSQNFSFVANKQAGDFQLGVTALSKMADVFVGINSSQQSDKFVPSKDAHINLFDGPNPAGNVGVQINHVAPVRKGEVVWTLAAEETIMLGRLIRLGEADFTRIIAVGGSEISCPQYVKTVMGASVKEVLAVVNERTISDEQHKRIIDGNPLVGQKISINDYIGPHTTEVCVLPEGDNVHEAFGWILPRFNQHSVSRSYLSSLFKNKQYAPDCRIKGGQRHMIMSGEYDKVFPMDIYPEYLIKSIITGNIDKQEELGIYEVAPEDFAVAEYVDSSKLELQRIVREGLEILRKENA